MVSNTQEQELPTISGVIERYDSQPGGNQNGTWVKHGAQIAGVWYSTVSNSMGADLERAYASGSPVFIAYEVEQKGSKTYNNIQTLQVMGAPGEEAGEPAAQPAVPAPPDSKPPTETPVSGLRKGEFVDLSAWEKKGYLVIYPAEGYIREVSERHVVRLEMIKPDPDRDFYKQGSGWAPVKQFLLKVSDLAGLRWDPDRCFYEVNERMRKVFKSVCYIRLADGTMKAYPGHKEVDLEVELLEVEDRAAELTVWKNNQKVPATEEQKAAYIRKETIRLRKHAGSMAETKSMLRAVRGALSLRATYTDEEIKRPWLVPRIDFQPNYDNPDIQKQLIGRGLNAAGDLYSTPQPIDFSQTAAMAPETSEPPLTDQGPQEVADDDCPF